MSRTYVHEPYHVKVFAPMWRSHFREAHRHDEGPCDLDQFDPRAPWSATRCHIDLALLGRNIHCGCRMCTGQFSRRLSRRRERTVLRAQLRAVVKTPGGDVDVPALRVSAW